MNTHQQYLRLAANAAGKAAALAEHAERAARNGERQHQAQPLADAGALWADIAHAYTAIADALPEPMLGEPVEETSA